MFAKLFDTKYGQVVVLKQDNEDGDPEIRFYAEPEGLGVCSMAFSYEEDKRDKQEEGFDKVNFEMAEAAGKQLSSFEL
jgi:hypothetical protein